MIKYHNKEKIINLNIEIKLQNFNQNYLPKLLVIKDKDEFAKLRKIAKNELENIIEKNSLTLFDKIVK